MGNGIANREWVMDRKWGMGSKIGNEKASFPIPHSQIERPPFPIPHSPFPAHFGDRKPFPTGMPQGLTLGVEKLSYTCFHMRETIGHQISYIFENLRKSIFPTFLTLAFSAQKWLTEGSGRSGL